MPEVLTSIFSRNAKSNALVRNAFLIELGLNSGVAASRSQDYIGYEFASVLNFAYIFSRKPIAGLEKGF